MQVELFEKIIHLNKSTKRVFEKYSKKIAKKYKLSFSEVLVLHFLANHEDISAFHIVKKAGFSKSYVSGAIASLCKKKYIELENDLEDKRIQKIVTLEKAEDVIKDLKMTTKKWIQGLKKEISKEELQTFIHVIDKVTKNMEKFEEGKEC